LSGEKNKEEGYIRKFVNWIDERFGFSKTILRPQPRYSLHPLYWLGALAFTAFLIQGFSGMLLLQHYRPIVDQAYESVSMIRDMVPFGRTLATLHLYCAYSMIIFAFLHLVRAYFLKQYTRPRELMWIVGVLMGLTALASSFTGYLLPWTVISKSAIDVSIGLLMNLPEPINLWIKTLISGTGSEQELLSRFFAFHVVVLPAVLLVLFAIKMHMFEVHGASEPIRRRFMKDVLDYREEAEEKVEWFPEILTYYLILVFSFIAAILIISTIIPSELPPKYTPEEAAKYTPQPEWYFLWMYQILKIEIFEGAVGVRVALTLFTILALIVIFLPFIDRSKKLDIWDRPVQITIGIIAVVEIFILTIWGAFTPGMTIPLIDAIIVLGVPAVVIAGIMYLLYRRVKKIRAGEITLLYEKFIKTSKARYLAESLIFNLLVCISAASTANIINLSSLHTLTIPVFSALSVILVFSMALLVKYFVASYCVLYRIKSGCKGVVA